MCQRKEGEVWVAYAIRQIAERPTVVLAFVGLIAAGVMYNDMRTLLKEQTSAYTEVANTLRAMDVRLQVLETQILKNNG